MSSIYALIMQRKYNKIKTTEKFGRDRKTDKWREALIAEEQ